MKLTVPDLAANMYQAEVPVCCVSLHRGGGEVRVTPIQQLGRTSDTRVSPVVPECVLSYTVPLPVPIFAKSITER